MTILSLHYLLQLKIWDEATQKLARKTERAKLLKYGCLPLHVACYYGAPLVLIRALVAAYPDAISTAATNGYTPYDVALEFYDKQSPEFGDVLKLVKPAGLQTPDVASARAPIPGQQPGAAPSPGLAQKLSDGVVQGVGRKVGQEIGGKIFGSGAGQSGQGVAQDVAAGAYYAGDGGQGMYSAAGTEGMYYAAAPSAPEVSFDAFASPEYTFEAEAECRVM